MTTYHNLSSLMVGVIFSIFLFHLFFFLFFSSGWRLAFLSGGWGWRILLVVGFGPSFVDSPVFSLRFFAFRFKLCLWVTWDFFQTRPRGWPSHSSLGCVRPVLPSCCGGSPFLLGVGDWPFLGLGLAVFSCGWGGLLSRIGGWSLLKFGLARPSHTGA